MTQDNLMDFDAVDLIDLGAASEETRGDPGQFGENEEKLP
jgi:hypothetical protein